MDSKIEDIRNWLRLNETKEFMERIKIHMQDADNMVHLALEKNEKEEAALHNAGMTAFREVLDLPEIIIEEIKEEMDGENN